MGTWGPAIFSDDLTSDVRDEFQKHILNGLTPEESTKLIIKAYQDAIEDPEEGPTFWIGLSAIQWKFGRLLPEVRDKALEIISQGGDLFRWEGSGVDLEKRRKVLEKLKHQLESTPPPPRKLKAPYLDSTDWPIGSVLAYRQPDEKFCLIRVIGHHKSTCGVSPVVDLFAWRGTEIPNMEVIKKLKMARGRRSEHYDIGPIIVVAGSAKDCPKDRFVVVGIQEKPMPWHKSWKIPDLEAFTNWHAWDNYSSDVIRFALGE